MLRIRAYLAVIALRHLLVGAAVWRSRGELADTAALADMVQLAPLEWWCIAMFAVSALVAVEVVYPREFPGRFMVVASIALTTAIAVSLLLSFAEDPQVTGILAILFLTLVAKDFLIVGLKWSYPFAGIDLGRLERVAGAT